MCHFDTTYIEELVIDIESIQVTFQWTLIYIQFNIRSFNAGTHLNGYRGKTVLTYLQDILFKLFLFLKVFLQILAFIRNY